MKFRSIGLTTLSLGFVLAMSIAPTLQAQDEEGGRRGGRGNRGGGQQFGGRGGGGGPGGQFGGRGGPGGGLGSMGAIELMSLLRIEEVRAEVEMEDEVYEAIQENMGDMRSLFREGPEGLAKADEKATELLDEVLTPAQQKRLMGLLLQQNGMRAVTNKLIAKEIGITEDDAKKIGEKLQESMEGMRDKMREAFQGGGGFDREKMQAMMKDAREEADDAAAEVLSSDQKKKIEELKGEKFEFPERSFGRGGPGGGGRGQGGPGGAGGRGGQGGPGGGRPGQGGGRPGRGGGDDGDIL